jgi:hypothetical protein
MSYTNSKVIMMSEVSFLTSDVSFYYIVVLNCIIQGIILMV